MKFILLMSRYQVARVAVVLLLAAVSAATLSAEAPNFEQHVSPIFKQHCVACHNPDDAEAGLDLSSAQAAIAGSSGGEVLKAGLPESSPLYLTMTHHEDYPEMPPNKPMLSPKEIKLVQDWIAGGLIVSAGGKSQLREMTFEIAAGSSQRPPQVAFPSGWASPASQPESTAPNASPTIAMAASPWANLIAVSGHRKVHLYGDEDVDGAAKLVGSLEFPEGDVQDLRFSANGQLLLVAGGIPAKSGNVAVFDVLTGKRVATLGEEYDAVLSADISADHRYVALGTTSKLVKIYAADSGKLLHRIKKHTDWVSVVRFSPDGKQLASGDRNGGVFVWEAESGGIVYSLDEHKQKVTALSWRPDGAVLASAGEDGTFVLWDMKDGWATRAVKAHVEKALTRYSRRTGVLDITFAADGTLLTIGRDRWLRSWKVDGQPLKKLAEMKSLPLRLSYVAAAKQIVVGGFDGQLHWSDHQ